MAEPHDVTRTRYDEVAELYYDMFKDTLREHPFDRAMIDAFAERVQEAGAGPVADIGCGPGHITGYLHALGLGVQGIDLSPEMVALARREHPGIAFSLGDMSALDLPDAALGGVLSRASIIHTPPERIGPVFAEFHRVLAPGGLLSISFQASDRSDRLAWPFDHKVAPAWQWSYERVAELLRDTGFAEVARLVGAPEEDKIRGFHFCHLVMRKPGPEIS
ncbi:class I SAM-dependent methyltransferase [Glycomyces sp. NPDC047369]